MRNSKLVDKNDFFDLIPGDNGKFIQKFRTLFVDLHNTLSKLIINLCCINNDVMVAMKELTATESPLTPDEKSSFDKFILKNVDEVLKKLPAWQFIKGDSAFNSNVNPMTYFDDAKRQKVKELSATECSFIEKTIDDAQTQLNGVKTDKELRKKINQLKVKIDGPSTDSDVLQIQFSDIYLGTLSTKRNDLLDVVARSELIKTIKEQVVTMKDSYSKAFADKSITQLVNAIVAIVKSADEKQRESWKKVTNCIENKNCVQDKKEKKKSSSIFSCCKREK